VRIAPLFQLRPLDWEPPDPAEVDATFLTSANAARNAGPAAGGFLDRPCYAVGEATAHAAREAGFGDVRSGPSDGAALVAQAVGERVVRALHLCGRDHHPIGHPQLTVIRRFVYSADAVAALPAAAAKAIADGAVVLLHSRRAGTTFAGLLDAAGLGRGGITLAAISPAAASAAGEGWKQVEAAEAPRGEALLELAVKLCNTGREHGRGMV
jgi:uroporphyrinogen-III synthase